MTPVLSGRLQTRLFVAATVGALWTALVTLVLPMPAGMGLPAAYRMTFESLGLMAALGLGWELVYHLLQQARWDKDWPTLLGLVTVVNEAIPLWFVDRALHVVPSGAGPFVLPFAVHVGTTWLSMWLFLQGPVRVLHVRWRFEGNRVFLPVFRRRRGQDDWLDTRWLDSLRAMANAGPLAPAGAAGSGDVVAMRRGGGASGSLVEGVVCPHGHFGSADTAYCPVCGAMRTDTTTVLGPLPPVGVLVMADGTTRTVDENLTIAGSGDGVTILSDEDAPAEDVLARIELVGWQPVVFGRNHRATVVLPGGHRLTAAADVPVPLVAGTELVVGAHRIRYDSPYLADPDATVEFAGKEGVAVPAGGWTRGAWRGVAVAAGLATVAGAVTLAMLSGSSGGAGGHTEAQGGGGVPAPLSSFSVPPWTLPAQPTGSGTGLPAVARPGPPSRPLPLLPQPTFSFPTSPGNVLLPPPPPKTTRTQPPPADPRPRPTTGPSSQPPPSPVPTTALCDQNLVGMLQCTMGLLGG